jgi:transcriptional regulator with PAS, ATPase and Fis domain
VKGAFTGAVYAKKGLFELADKGTLFFDEIGNIPIETQAKLLRVMQEREFMRLGGMETIRVDARIIAATNCDLKEMVDEGRFREDLYYRLHVINIYLPPLRERKDDIPPLVQHFLEKYGEENGKADIELKPEALDLLMEYSWPGNVRELEHAIERAVILANGPSIRVRELPPEVTQKTRRRPGDDTLDLQEQERVMIERALEKFGGNRRRAAEALKISTVTLWRKMKQYGLSS